MISEHERLEMFLRYLAEKRAIDLKRPFADYPDMPDAAERRRLEMQAIPFGLPEKRAK